MRPTRCNVALVLVLLTALLASACGGSDSRKSSGATSSAPTPGAAPGAAPAGDAFYTPPDPLPAGAPGDVLRSRPWVPVPGATTSLVLYRSTDVRNAPIAVSGVVATPAGRTPPPGGWPVLDWAHGTTGLGDDCAPSKYPATSDARLMRFITTFVPRGFAVVATDYQGLGTPGGHPYVVGNAEGRNVLDMARAVTRLPGSGVQKTSPVIVWGHSQGGGSSVFAAELEPTYAPDVPVKGAVVGAPAAELRLLGAALRTSSYFGYIFLVAAGFQAAYPDVPLDRVLTPAGLAATKVAATGCADTVIDQVRGKNADEYLKADPGSTPPLSDLLEENTPGNIPTPVPMFIYQGDKDEQIPVVASQLLLQRMCKKGGFTVVRKVYPGQMHVQSIWAAEPDASRWIDDRLAGKPAPTDC